MAITDEELWAGEDSFEAFKVAAGDRVAPYFTENVVEDNLKTITRWGVENLPGGFSAARNIGFFELSFAQCLKAGSLLRDSNWISKADRRAQLQREHDALTAAESKQRYFDDPEYKLFIDRGKQ
jgi:hypothetical protein